MVLNKAQQKQLQEARKVASRSPKFNPTVNQWRTFKSQYGSWMNMTGISGMGVAGAAPEQIEFTKLCLEATM